MTGNKRGFIALMLLLLISSTLLTAAITSGQQALFAEENSRFAETHAGMKARLAGCLAVFQLLLAETGEHREQQAYTSSDTTCEATPVSEVNDSFVTEITATHDGSQYQVRARFGSDSNVQSETFDHDFPP